ncbi:hypothetical protein EV677_1492 [Herminiimonas fonticola]|uniref:Uncharacterized protein n=1 Tax=Herminiimonas fonticola TaxID=303380 RepID=A0A4R6GIS3_9BURK|nr:hypothetical protein Hfont_1454 [Herminiimonas fonticola]TDN94929.1 hypothetical protein EV677_1492 [Herminiimonas fonticola]
MKIARKPHQKVTANSNLTVADHSHKSMHHYFSCEELGGNQWSSGHTVFLLGNDAQARDIAAIFIFMV